MAALIALLGGLASAAPEQVGLIHRFFRRSYVSRARHPHRPLPFRPQVHISLTGRANEMGVDFVTSAGSSGLSARFGTSALSLSSVAPAVSTNFTGNGWTAVMNAAYMGGLSPNTTYFYQVGSDAEGWSAVFSFVNAPSARPHIACVYADFGYGNDVSMPTIIADAAAGGFDIVLHAGDVAYDLDSSSSQVGNEFMNAIQPYAASKPYMLATGKCVARQAPPPVLRPAAPGPPPPLPSCPRQPRNLRHAGRQPVPAVRRALFVVQGRRR